MNPTSVRCFARSGVLAAVMAAGLAAPQAFAASTPGGAKLTATIHDLGSAGNEEHYAVVWVTDASNTFITTLWKQGDPDFAASDWVKHFPTWETQRGTSTALPAAPDGYTSATSFSYAVTTPSPPAAPAVAGNAITITWNGKNSSGTVLPDGDYKFWIEYGEESGAHNVDGPLTAGGLTFTKGPGSFSVNPPNQGASGSPAGGSNFTGMSIVWTPTVTTPNVSVAVAPASVTEDGATNLVYTFTRTNSTGALTTNFSVAGTGTFGTDYTQSGAASFSASSGTVTFAAGSLTAAVTINPTADTTVEPNETAILTVTTGTGYNVGSPVAATGTITNDDTSVSVAVAPASVAENGGVNLVYTFTRVGNTTGTLTSNFSVGGTATFNTDYTQSGAATFSASSGTVTFAAASATAAVTVVPAGDTTVEPDETVLLTVTTGTGYNVGSPLAATGTIANDDTSVSVAVAPASVTEDGAINLVYTFTRTGVTTGALTANFAVGGSATFSSDYTQSGAASFSAASGTVTFAAGILTAAVTIDPTADSAVEPDETAILTVSAGAGYTVGVPTAATGTIANDDTAFSSWASVLPAGQNGPGQTPKNDGVTNLMKFACNLNPLAPDVRVLTVGGTETAGLPGKSFIGGKLRMEFLRRKAITNPGITYTLQFSADPGTAPWDSLDVTTTPPGASIDDNWERVTVDDLGTGAKRFGRLQVIQAP